MSDTFVETPAEPASNKLQLIAAILLGIAATLTAVSSYLGSLEDGDSLEGYTKSSQLVNDANTFNSQGNQTESQDQAIFVQYATALNTDQTDLADYLKTLMRPTMVEAVDWWVDNADNDEVLTPFDDIEGNPYFVEDYDNREAVQKQADKAFAEGTAANDKGDKYGLATVLFALTLFFGGIATLFNRRKVSVGLLFVATAVLAVGGAQFVVAMSS